MRVEGRPESGALRAGGQRRAGAKRQQETPLEFPTGFSVPRTGIEPARLAAHAPETCASTSSATWALTHLDGLRGAKVIHFRKLS